MNYEANKTHWPMGSLVIHDADAKRADMLMRVEGYDREGLCLTRYIAARVDMRSPRSTAHSKRQLANRLAVLHDPARFGIAVPGREGTGQ